MDMLEESKPQILGFAPAATQLVAFFSDSPNPQPVVGFFTIAYPGTYPGLTEHDGYPTQLLPNAHKLIRNKTVAAIVNRHGEAVPVTHLDAFQEVRRLAFTPATED